MGVMNGTRNYILTRMEASGLSYDEVFAEADALGYLEADPNLDVGGIDSTQIIAAFSHRFCRALILMRWKPKVSIHFIDDIHGQLTCRVPDQAGVAEMTGRGLEQRMSPCRCPPYRRLASLKAAPTWWYSRVIM